MSLINQMLKDLDKRREKHATSQNDILSDLKPATQSPVKLWLSEHLLGIILIMSLPILLALIWQLISSPNASAEATLKPMVTDAQHQTISLPASREPSQPQASTEPPTTAPPIVKLKRLIVSGKSGETQMLFLLSADTQYHLTNGPHRNQLSLTLLNTKLSPSFTSSDKTILPLKGIQTKMVDDHLNITMTLAKNTKIKQLALNHDDTPQLLLTLTSLKEAVRPISKPRPQRKATRPTPKKKASRPAPVVTVKKAKPPKPKISVRKRLYQKALNEAAGGRADLAIQHLETLLIKYPTDIPLRESLAKILLEHSKTERASKVLEVGMRDFPHHRPFTQLQARIFVNQGKLTQALQMLRAAAPTLDKDPEYYAFIAALYQRLNKPALAARLYNRLLHYQPRNSVWWTGLGISLEASGNLNAALDAYQRGEATGTLNAELQTYVENRISTLKNGI